MNAFVLSVSHIGICSGLISIGKDIAQSGFQVVGVHPASLCDSRNGSSNGGAVLNDRFARRYGKKRKFMSLGDVLLQGELQVIQPDDGSVRKRLQRHGHTVLGMNADKCLHTDMYSS